MNLRQSWQRIVRMIVKEFIQALRDPRMRFILIGPPIIQMMIYGYAATYEIKHVTMALLDQDNTQESRDLIARFTGSQYFDLRPGHYADRPDQLRNWIDRGDILIALQIDSGFAQRLRNGQGAQVEVIVDASNSNTALISLGYLTQIGAKFAQDYLSDELQRGPPRQAAFVPQVDLEARPWFNEGLESKWFFVPGVICNLLLLMVMTLTCSAVVREREIGTLEQIMVTPIRRWEFILGKTLPFYLIGIFDAVLISLVGTFWFGVPFRGKVVVMAVGSMIFLLSSIGVGLFLSTISATQQQSMISSFFFMMPAITLSGFATPISSMPWLWQKLSYLNPMRYFMIVVRGIYLKGVGFDVLWPQFVGMAIIGVTLLTISVLRFHKSLE
ncbi:MAG TPA: ABC transporter permease [Methylomirabilota bacterium]|nr:ABC transporter permease [Methylomirabilota bacterium]